MSKLFNRLIRLGLIEEKHHSTDKRSKNLFVSKEGRELMGKLFVSMDKVSRLILSDLSGVEQLHLMSILQRLDNFHNPIFLNNLKQVEETLKN